MCFARYGARVHTCVAFTLSHFRTRTQVFLYKRAQIFVGDLYGAFQGKGLGAFHDLHFITMFADYR